MLAPMRAALLAILVALALSLVFAALSWCAAQRDAAGIQNQLRPLVAAGEFSRGMGLPLGGRRVPAWEGNDCLVLMMLALPAGDPWRDALSPPLPVRLVPREPPAAEDRTSLRCLRLAELLDPAAPPEPLWRYDRYLHGHRVVAALLLPWLGPSGLRAVIALALPGTLAALALVAAIRAWRHRARPGWRRDAAFAWLALGLLLFQGVALFGRYFSHAMSDLVPAIFLWLLYLSPPRMPRCDAGPAALLGAFGCCVAIFEFLTGGLPLAAALICLVAAVQDRPPSFAGTLAALTAFGTGALVPILGKFLLGALVFDDFLAAEAGGVLLHRIGGVVLPEMSPREIAALAAVGFDAALLDSRPVLRLPYLLVRFGYFAFVPGLGSTGFGLAILAVSGLGVPWLARRRIAAGGAAAARAWAVLAGCGLVLAWYLVFLNHTLLHTVWMVRCVAVFPLAFGLLLLRRAPRQAVRSPPALSAA